MIEQLKVTRRDHTNPTLREHGDYLLDLEKGGHKVSIHVSAEATTAETHEATRQAEGTLDERIRIMSNGTATPAMAQLIRIGISDARRAQRDLEGKVRAMREELQEAERACAIAADVVAELETDADRLSVGYAGRRPSPT